MRNLNLRIEGRVGIIEFDQPDSKVNVLNAETMQELSEIIKQFTDRSESNEKSKVEALLVTSKKEGIFIAGADIKEIEGITSVDEAQEKVQKGKEILNVLNNLNIATVAVINGACLGGGLELALACKYRVASFSEKVKIGFPEVKLGVIPGFDGTQRLPRITGLISALNMILSGRIISGKDALKNKLVDRLFPQTMLLDDAIDFAKGILENRIHIKRKKKKKIIQRLLENTPFGRMVVYSQSKKNVLKTTKGHYPAPLKALEVIRRTYGGNIKKGSLVESKAFSELAVTDISKNLIKVFYLNEEFKKYKWINDEIIPAQVKKCGVVGAGVMGGGIVQFISFNDILVRLKDINCDAIKSALKTAYGLFKYAIKKKKLTKHQVEYKFGLISPTITYRGFENADLVIEAVVEDLNIKQNVFKEVSEIMQKEAIIASNTSALPIIEMANATNTPENVVGLHFFNPVHRMPLVEIIRSEKTSEETLAKVISFARRIGKVVIVVKDVPGFLINRILLSYLNEAGLLIEEGLKIDRIDRAALTFGMPMGPIELIDEVGVDVGYKVAQILEEAYGPRMKAASILGEIKQRGLFGKKTKKGFYIHKGKKEKIPNGEIYKLISTSSKDKISDEVILKRMIYIMINEAARCLEEGVVDRSQTIDIGMIMGTGFPPFRGGLLRYADSVGVDNIVKDLKGFEKSFNSSRFEPCKYLIDKAEKKERFYL